MEHYKKSKLLNYSILSEFVTKINDLISGQYSESKNIRFNTLMLRSNLSDYSDAYIVVKREISVTGNEHGNRRNKKLIFKKNTPFR